MSESEDLKAQRRLRRLARAQHRQDIQNAVREKLKGDVDVTEIMKETRATITKDVTEQIAKRLQIEIERQVADGVRQALTKISIVEILKLKVAEYCGQVVDKMVQIKLKEDHW